MFFGISPDPAYIKAQKMKKSDVQKLSHGVYRIYWKEGGTSVAAVGSTPSGARWLAPTNWVSIGTDANTLSHWKSVRKVELITTK